VRLGNEATSIMKQGNTVGKQKAVSKSVAFFSVPQSVQVACVVQLQP
jgi:hypothetical protein